MKTNAKGIGLIIEFEGFRSDAYLCPAGVWTIGYGSTKGVKKGDRITMYDAKERLKRELVEYEEAVLSTLKDPNENEFSACVVLAYNIGVAGFKSSSVVKAHNRGNKEAAARAFNLWNKATVGGEKKTLPGLTRRRMAEAALYLEPERVEAAAPEPMPQAIEPERPMTASTINRASVVAGGTATIAAVTETINTVNGLKNGVESLGGWLVPALLVAVVGLCAYVVWERVRQRKEGFA